jgi:hypothetical protein
MSSYTPDSWAIVKIIPTAGEEFYKVLASWYGGYADADSWRLSSGIESMSENGDIITMPQSSGSVYVLHKSAEHMSGLMSSIFKSLSEPNEKYKVELVTLEEVKAALC